MRALKKPTAVLSDVEVVTKILGGEKVLYELIMRRYNQRLFRICGAFGKGGDESEEILQEVHINAYEGLAGFKGHPKFSTWLTRILIGVSLVQTKLGMRFISLQEAVAAGISSERSGSGARYHLAEAGLPGTDTPDIRSATVTNIQVHNILERAIDALAERYRAVYVMREVEGMSVTETSECLRISEANVNVRLNRARHLLRRELALDYKNETVYHFDLVRCDRVVNNVMQRLVSI